MGSYCEATEREHAGLREEQSRWGCAFRYLTASKQTYSQLPSYFNNLRLSSSSEKTFIVGYS